jgi:hypothetical protein
MHLIQGLIAGTAGTEFKEVVRPVANTDGATWEQSLQQRAGHQYPLGTAPMLS